MKTPTSRAKPVGLLPASWLADRGFGRPQQTTLVGTVDEVAQDNPLAELSDEEIRARLRVLRGEAG